MATLYNKATSVLLDCGWAKESAASFTKRDLEVYFDTSSYVQVFDRNSKQCLYESHLCSIGDYNRFLEGLHDEFAKA